MNAIIILAVIAVLLIVVILLICGIYSKILGIFRVFFGNDVRTLRDAKEEIDKAALNRDATIKSLCAMTRVMLPRIKKDFPEFDWNEYRNLINEKVKDYIVKELNGNDPVVHDTEISDYRNVDGSCTIYTQTSAGYTLEGGKYEKRFDVQIVYVQDYLKVPQGQTGVGLNCPNCGAPVKILGNKYCEYCGTAITEINSRVWKILPVTVSR